MARKIFDNMVKDGQFKTSGGGLPAGFDPHKSTTPPTPTPDVTVTKTEEQSGRREGEQERKRIALPRTTPKVAAVMTHPDVQRAIKKHVNSLKGRSLKTSLGAETLACVERQYDKLRTAWADTNDQPPAETDTQGDPVLGAGMFGLSTQATETKVSWQLWGANRSQIGILDKAYIACGAPSRSAFVEKAIRLDLMEKEPRPPRKPHDESN
jgi:hypothetical protein